MPFKFTDNRMHFLLPALVNCLHKSSQSFVNLAKKILYIVGSVVFGVGITCAGTVVKFRLAS